MRTRPLLLKNSPWLSVLLASLIVGCGGHHHHSGGSNSSSGSTSGNGSGSGGTTPAVHKGNVHLRIDWPTDRAAGAGTQSLHVEIVHDDLVLSDAVVQKPRPEVTLTNVDSGDHVIQITAHADNAAATDPVAQMYIPVTVTDSGTAEAHLSLTSESDHLVAKPVALSLEPGASKTITVTSVDTSGNATLVKPGAFRFVSSDPTIASVDAKGKVVAGGTPGAATVSITEADSGQSVVVPLSVLGVTVTPATFSVVPQGTGAFSAGAFGLSGSSVAWSVQEHDGGTVDANGLYTAPAAGGTYHILATSTADPTRKATATVTVAAGNTSVTVH